VKQENPVSERSSGSLSALAYDRVLRRRDARKTDQNNRQNQPSCSHGRVT